MSPRTPTLPPHEPLMWRKLLARTHPKAGESVDISTIRETVSLEDELARIQEAEAVEENA